MCRWIAYRGEAVALERYVTSPVHSLIEQSRRALESTDSTNGDGFGLGWYGDREEPGLYKDVRPAWADENLRHLCKHIHSRLFFAHVRASTGTPTTRPNCHPFAYGKWLFMHNGSIGNWTRIRRWVEALIPDEYYATRLGTTDSEALFLAILGAGADKDPIAATAQTLAAIEGHIRDSGTQDPIRFTSAMSDGKTIWAFRYASGDTKANSLYYRDFGDHAVITSEPLDREQDFWKQVPSGHVIVATEGKPVELRPMPTVMKLAAE